MKNKSKKRPAAASQLAKRRRRVLLVLMFPILFAILALSYLEGQPDNKTDVHIRSEVPNELIPIYLAAENEYGVPWYLLAAHHRVETVFSTMEPMISPAGAEGHMQVRP